MQILNLVTEARPNRTDHEDTVNDLHDKAKRNALRSAHEAVYYALMINKRFPEGERVILENPYQSYDYAKQIIKGRWPEAEQIIATSAEAAYYYAKDIIKERWPKGEAAILTSPHWAYLYARNIIKDRWLAAEPIIHKKSDIWWQHYKDFIVTGD